MHAYVLCVWRRAFGLGGMLRVGSVRLHHPAGGKFRKFCNVAGAGGGLGPGGGGG